MFFVSSLPPKVKRLSQIVSDHWKIENSEHYVLDVNFAEDASRTRRGSAAEISSAIRRMSLNTLQRDTTVSKWNKIEHRLFCHITRNWRGVPLESHQIVVSVSSNRTNAGLEVHCKTDSNYYPKSRKITDSEMSQINIKRNVFHGDWNYEIRPSKLR